MKSITPHSTNIANKVERSSMTSLTVGNCKIYHRHVCI